MAALVAGLVFYRGSILAAILRPISFAARLINPVRLQETDGRTNILILGLDTRVRGGLLNTDTILVGSFSLTEGDPVLVSIPRDFWVSFETGGVGKINSAYALAAAHDGTIDEERGVEALKAVVERVLGIPIHYWAIVSFEGFTYVIDTLDGINVCVDTTFDDYSYPVPGRENAFPLTSRYEWLHFDAGCQEMDGETALKYSRSRMGTAGEGSDFARARRQQKVVRATADKALSLSLLFNPGKIASLYQQITETIRTNASVLEAERGLSLVYEFRDDLGDIRSLVVDPESGLTARCAPAQCGDAYAIVPAGGDFSAIHGAVHELLFGVVAGATSE
jgi:LCP family protein required for cell wall assembly